MFEIKKCNGTPASYAAMVDILAAVAPNHPVSGEDLANEDLSLGDAHPHCRWLSWRGGTPIGFCVGAQATRDRSPGRLRVYAAAAPRWQGQGAGRAPWNHCLSALLAGREVAEFTCDTRGNQERGIRFLQDRGFILKRTICQSEPDVTGYDLTEKPQRRHSLPDQGIKILSLTDVATVHPDWFERYHKLRTEFMADTVYPTPPLTLEEHRTEHRRNREFNPDMTFNALHDREWLAPTALWLATANPTLWWTSLTGAGRAHRRQGLASALETTAMETVQRRGGARIRTDTIARPSMFKINKAFGFRLLPAARTRLRPLRGEADVREVRR